MKMKMNGMIRLRSAYQRELAKNLSSFIVLDYTLMLVLNTAAIHKCSSNQPYIIDNFRLDRHSRDQFF